jgi:L-fucose isomerase-like protein
MSAFTVRPPRVGVVANSIGVFSEEGKRTAETQMRALFEALARDGAIEAGSILHPKRIFGPHEAADVADRFSRAKVDAVIILNSAFPNGNAFLTLAMDPYLCRLPLIVTAPPEVELANREWTTNAYCGLLMNNYAAKRLGRHMFALAGWPESKEYQQRMRGLLRTVTAIREMRSEFVGRIGDAPSGFHSATGDQLAYARVLGTRVETIDLSAVLNAYETRCARGLRGEATFSEADVEATFRRMMSVGTVEAASDAVRKAARLFHAFRLLIEANGFTSTSFRCWPELMDFGLKVASCYSIGMLMSEGVVRAAACEGDWPTAVGQSLSAVLSGKPAACLDFVNELAAKPVVQLGHCGVGIPCVMAETAVADTSPNRQGGMVTTPACVGQFEYGPKTGVCLMTDAEGRFRMLAFAGESRRDTAQGLRYCAADVEVRNPSRLNDIILEHGFPHHLAVVMGDIRQELKWFCEFHGITYCSPDS